MNIQQRYSCPIKASITLNSWSVLKKALLLGIAAIILFYFVQPLRAQTQIVFSDPIKLDVGETSDPLPIAIDDLNGDSKLDIVVGTLDFDSAFVFLNRTTPGGVIPSFSARTGFYVGGIDQYSVAISDLNGDDKPDVAVTNYTVNKKRVSILLNITPTNDPIPQFLEKQDFITVGAPSWVDVCDLNDDGKQDLAVSNGSNNMSVYLNTTPPGTQVLTFSSGNFIAGNQPKCVAHGDLNADGKPDLAVANNGSNTLSIFLNTTQPGVLVPDFSKMSDITIGNYGPSLVAISDLNGDGKQDIVTNWYKNVSIFSNTTPPGEFVPTFSRTDIATDNTFMRVAIDDLNEDSKPDLFLTYTGFVSIFLNTTMTIGGIPSFSEMIVSTFSCDIAIGDLNNNGKKDLATMHLDYVNVLLNDVTLISIKEDWNLVSVPRIQTDYSVETLFPGTSGGVVYQFIPGFGYTSVTTLALGVGYWANFLTAADIAISGAVPGAITVTVVQAGWTLLGSRATPVQKSSLILSDGASFIGDFQRYIPETGNYEPTTVINPGEAVWANVDKVCTITIP